MKIKYNNYKFNSIRECPICNSDDTITIFLEYPYNEFERPINSSNCMNCGYEFDHVYEYEKGLK